jgi:cytosine/adenosine deaminase-related metal-dependent hydrolase
MTGVIENSSEWSLTARWVFPVDAPPLERGIITIVGDRIAAVEPHGTRTADYDLGNAAILPGLVNAHTHLDLTGAKGTIPPSRDFTAWLRRVIDYRRSRTKEQIEEDIQQGLSRSQAAGTTVLADISNDGSSWELLSNASMRSVVYLEWIGLGGSWREQAKARMTWWKSAHLRTSICKPGVSPHAPYSVHTRLVDFTYKTKLPFCIHLAETTEEMELIESRQGPFVRFLQDLGVWEPDGIVPSIKSILVRTRRANHPVYVHCNYLSPDAMFLSAGSVIYCPRTHAAFGHPPHPFREFLARGVRVALGTDSLASNPDLDVLAEARFVHAKHPDVASDVLLRMVTLSGAEALGWADETGSLTPGKSADLIVLPLPNEQRKDPHDLVLESTTAVRAVLFRGNWTRRPDEVPC